jgi:hypothetical protein
VVTIIVSQGPTEETFYVHKDFICFHSPFFDAAFNGNFAEGQSQVMRLPDVEPATFGFVVEWIYKKSFNDKGTIGTAIRVWILADRFLMPTLQNKAMDAIVANCNTRGDSGFPPVDSGIRCINQVYEAKGETMLKKVMADKFAFGISKALLEKWKPFLPQDMLIDIMMAYSEDFHGLREADELDEGPLTLIFISAAYYVAVDTGGDKKCAN